MINYTTPKASVCSAKKLVNPPKDERPSPGGNILRELRAATRVLLDNRS